MNSLVCCIDVLHKVKTKQTGNSALYSSTVILMKTSFHEESKRKIIHSFPLKYSVAGGESTIPFWREAFILFPIMVRKCLCSKSYFVL